MKAAIALPADYTVQNYVRKIVAILSQNYNIPFFGSLLPAHVSLKQPFTFESMEKLEHYFDMLAAQIAPFTIELSDIYCAEWSGYGILGLNVVETPPLRQLHNQINRELGELFEDTSAPHDGDLYHFHLTIEMGRTDRGNPYKAYFDQLTDKRANLRFTAQTLALFYYTGETYDCGSFIVYKVLPLTGSGH
ncbi:MAG: 2'-5' RNA ligase family protein [Anaerolineae bacterium]|nr:2'-5' RNA ligase family protein [Anaerolineae bacterium]